MKKVAYSIPSAVGELFKGRGKTSEGSLVHDCHGRIGFQEYPDEQSRSDHACGKGRQPTFFGLGEFVLGELSKPYLAYFPDSNSV